ncbi:MAG: calcium/sodium antiporter [Rhodospirillaceae bacterium]|jgi:cation:H+ antiporter|nr:calcium/sodium antiporter [Rhodospirillaceae bacterium]MBT6512915.1 calcium/sodium antiporter [Rhodospirillaceae bacterium]MBT7615196.1 calcium/sodium antiporter [Rhodospirillaceae bacterium]
MPLVLTISGFVFLFLGGEALVRGSVSIARRVGVSEIAVGVVLVGFGTSAPELLVSIESALLGHADLAVGNVVGSNIANILLIVGAAALVMPISLSPGAGQREAIVVLLATVIVVGFSWFGELEFWHGVVMLAGLAAYLAMAWCSGGSDWPDDEEEAEPMPHLGRAVLYAGGGLGLLVLGADLLVEGAIEIARKFDVSEATIGLTIVAVGSSLPELAASTVAALRGRPSVAIGNVLGSNLFNLLGALGIVALVMPVRTDAPDVSLAMLAMLALTGCFVALVALRRVSRPIGVLFLLAYAGFVWMQFSIHGTP